jgi:hypothetical protein
MHWSLVLHPDVLVLVLVLHPDVLVLVLVLLPDALVLVLVLTKLSWSHHCPSHPSHPILSLIATHKVLAR